MIEAELAAAAAEELAHPVRKCMSTVELVEAVLHTEHGLPDMTYDTYVAGGGLRPDSLTPSASHPSSPIPIHPHAGSSYHHGHNQPVATYLGTSSEDEDEPGLSLTISRRPRSTSAPSGVQHPLAKSTQARSSTSSAAPQASNGELSGPLAAPAMDSVAEVEGEERAVDTAAGSRGLSGGRTFEVGGFFPTMDADL